MEYKLIGKKRDIFDDELDIILKNRGVENKQDFLNIENYPTSSFKLLPNIEKAIKKLDEHLKKDSRIHIIVDSDADGYTSATIIYRYLSNLYNSDKISWNTHPSKKHGIFLEELKNFEFDLLIVPDGGTNDLKAHKELKEQGIDIIILDHHEIEKNIYYEIPKFEDNVIVVNNQFKEYPNKNLSGSEIVYKFCQGLDAFYGGLGEASRYIDLASIGAIADVIDSRDLENRHIINRGLNNFNNSFLIALKDKLSYKISELNMIAVMFYLAPAINSVTRVGTPEERDALFRAMIDDEFLVKYKPRGKKKQYVFLCKDMARQCVNIKSRQDREKKKILKEVNKIIKENDLSRNKIILLSLDGDLAPDDFTGLIANSVASEYQRPSIVVIKKEDSFLGSGRGYEQHIIDDFRQFVIDSNTVEFASGHDNAFGVEFKTKEDMEKFVEYANEKLSEVKHSNIYKVDFVYKESEVTPRLVEKFDSYTNLYGQNFEEPRVVVTDISFNVDDVYINDRGTVCSIEVNNIKYLWFKDCKEVYSSFVANPSMRNLTIDVVGRFNINEYNGEKIPQCVISDYEIVDFSKEKEIWF